MKHGVKRPGFFPNRNHLCNHGRKHRYFLQWTRYGITALDILLHVLHGILDNSVPRRLAGDFYCLQYWNTGADQSSQRPAKPGHGNLLNYVTQFHREFEPNPIPHLRTGPGILEPPDSEHQQEDQRKDYEPECSQEITQKYHYPGKKGSWPPSEAYMSAKIGITNRISPNMTRIANIPISTGYVMADFTARRRLSSFSS